MKPRVSGISSQYSPTDPLHDRMRRAGRSLHVHRPDDEVLARARVTSPAGFWKVRRIHRRSRVGRPEDIVHAVAGSTVGNTLGTASRRPDRGSCRRRKEPGLPADCNATPGVRRCGIARKLPSRHGLRSPAIPALSAPGSSALRGSRCTPEQRTRQPSWPVHAHSQVRFADVRVALATGRRNIPVVGLGTRIFRGKDSVAPVTIRAGCGRSVSIRHRSSMHALPIEFHGMRERNLVPRQELPDCCDRKRKCQANSSWPQAKPHRSRAESGARTRGKTRSSARPDRPPRPPVRVCFAGIPSLRRHGTARILPARSEPPQPLRADLHGRIGTLRRRACHECCWTHAKPRSAWQVEH